VSQAVETIERPRTLRDEPAPESDRFVPPPLPQREERDAVEAPQRTSDAEQAAARHAEAARLQAEEAARIARQAQEELQAARAAADARRATEMQQAEAEERERIAAEQARIEAELQAEAQAELESHIESELRPGAEATVTAAPPRPETEVQPPATEPPVQQPIRSYPGDEESSGGSDDSDDAGEPQARGTVFMHATPTVETDRAERAAEERRKRILAAADDPTAEFPKGPDLDEFDIAYEVERLLKARRFDKREEPFNGFKSPPGRF
jgi:dTMP kinase